MAHRSTAGRVTEALADATGRTDEQVRLALAAAAALAAVLAVLRLADHLADLGSDVLGARHRRPTTGDAASPVRP